MTNTRACDLLAALVTYPDDRYLELVAECHRQLESDCGEAADCIARFRERVGDLTIDELQELFTVTFDLNPVCALEVGWHLHGDTYERGEFLVRMRDLLRRVGVEESTELPDHLAHLLAALPRLDPDGRRALIGQAVAPAVEKMLVPLATRINPFEHVLSAVHCLLSTELPLPVAVRSSGIPDPRQPEHRGEERTS